MWPNKPKKNPPQPQKPPLEFREDAVGDVSMRWMIPADYATVIEIEKDSFDFPWTKAELTKFLKHHNHVGYVAILNGHIVGYYLYELHPSHVELVCIAVHKDGRRIGVGRKMMKHIEAKLNSRRPKVKLMCREKNVPGQMFFKAVGYYAKWIVRDAYEETAENGLLFEKGIGEKPVDERWVLKNRVSGFFERSGE